MTVIMGGHRKVAKALSDTRIQPIEALASRLSAPTPQAYTKRVVDKFVFEKTFYSVLDLEQLRGRFTFAANSGSGNVLIASSPGPIIGGSEFRYLDRFEKEMVRGLETHSASGIAYFAPFQIGNGKGIRKKIESRLPIAFVNIPITESIMERRFRQYCQSS